MSNNKIELPHETLGEIRQAQQICSSIQGLEKRRGGNASLDQIEEAKQLENKLKRLPRFYPESYSLEDVHRILKEIRARVEELSVKYSDPKRSPGAKMRD